MCLTEAKHAGSPYTAGVQPGQLICQRLHPQHAQDRQRQQSQAATAVEHNDTQSLPYPLALLPENNRVTHKPGGSRVEPSRNPLVGQLQTTRPTGNWLPGPDKTLWHVAEQNGSSFARGSTPHDEHKTDYATSRVWKYRQWTQGHFSDRSVRQTE